MEFSFVNQVDGSMVKTFLAHHGVSKRLLSKIKFHGGKIEVNGREENAIFRLKSGDKVTIRVPIEPDNESLEADHSPIDIVFEDEHYLVLNKPAGRPSITGINHPGGAMSNLAKGYIVRQNYEDQSVHIVTRLDRNTSGLMFFAKHRYAHALITREPYRARFEKRYFAIINQDEALPAEGEINAPIGRRDGSIIERRVRYDDTAKEARTSYQIVRNSNDLSLLDIVLHTGRTHQIRVHFSHLGHPLIGDDLYGGNHELLTRQALHCHHISFLHPFTDEQVEIELELPDDMADLLKN